MQTKIIIKLNSGKRLNLTKEEYEELKSEFRDVILQPYQIPSYPQYPFYWPPEGDCSDTTLTFKIRDFPEDLKNDG